MYCYLIQLMWYVLLFNTVIVVCIAGYFIGIEYSNDAVSPCMLMRCFISMEPNCWKHILFPKLPVAKLGNRESLRQSKHFHQLAHPLERDFGSVPKNFPYIRCCARQLYSRGCPDKFPLHCSGDERPIIQSGLSPKKFVCCLWDWRLERDSYAVGSVPQSSPSINYCVHV